MGLYCNQIISVVHRYFCFYVKTCELDTHTYISQLEKMNDWWRTRFHWIQAVYHKDRGLIFKPLWIKQEIITWISWWVEWYHMKRQHWQHGPDAEWGYPVMLKSHSLVETRWQIWRTAPTIGFWWWPLNLSIVFNIIISHVWLWRCG